jgi:putative ATPase
MNPLADRLRPNKLSEFIGQKHIIGEDKLLHKAIKSGNIFSMIFWGPPGVGKTTLARIIANEIEAEFMEFSAVTTGIAELKKIFEGLHGQLKLGQKLKTVIFVDEIHRFNKAQQDAFLPYVENGTIILIGATTENPSFEIISPLLSRSRVFVLEQLGEDDLDELINKGLKELKAKIKKDAKKLLIEFANGDGRVILNTLEIAADYSKNITKDLIEEALQKKALSYDKAGEDHYNTISAFIKSMRASNADAALYYLARMVDAGEDPLFIARRMVIFASEDIGMAQPTALVVANEVFRACETIGYPECQINLAHGVAYLALAKKDRASYDAYFEALGDVKKYGHLPIPLKIRNAPTKLMKQLDYGKGYQMYGDEDLLPEKLKAKKYLIKK